MKKFLAGLMSIALVIMIGLSFAACGSDPVKDLDGKTYELSGFKFIWKMTNHSKDIETGEWTVSYDYYETDMEEVLKELFMIENEIESTEFTEEQANEFNKYVADFTKEYIKNSDELKNEEDFNFSYQIRFEDGKMYFESLRKGNRFGHVAEYKESKYCNFSYKEDNWSSIIITKEKDGEEYSIIDAVKLDGYTGKVDNKEEYTKLIVSYHPYFQNIEMNVLNTNYDNFDGALTAYVNTKATPNTYNPDQTFWSAAQYVGYSEVYTLVK